MAPLDSGFRVAIVARVSRPVSVAFPKDGLCAAYRTPRLSAEGCDDEAEDDQRCAQAAAANLCQEPAFVIIPDPGRAKNAGAAGDRHGKSKICRTHCGFPFVEDPTSQAVQQGGVKLSGQGHSTYCLVTVTDGCANAAELGRVLINPAA